MTLEIEYTPEQRLLLPNIECHCNLPHNVPDIDIFVGEGIIQNAAAYISPRNFGINALLVADSTTYKIAGKKVERLLTEAGFKIKPAILKRSEQLEPDQSALGEILLNMDSSINFLVAVGSGVVNDLTRYTAFNTGRPFVSVATAASMDGYVSVVAPLLHNGLKVNKPATYPKVLICDLEIIKHAPYAMTISGFGDVIGKYIAVADWNLGRIINGEEYCPVCVELINQAVQKCVANVERIRNQTAVGIKSLLEALLLAGLTILILENTRSVASNEHNMAHYWDMMKLKRNEQPPSHGIAVGVATGYVLKFYEKFFQTDVTRLQKSEIMKKRLSRGDIEQDIIAKYGPELGLSVISDNHDVFLTYEEQERRIAAFLQKQTVIKKELALLPSWDDIRSIFGKISFPLTAAEIGIDRELLENALLYAKDYRKRYSVFNLASELGILPELVAQILD